MRRDLCAAEILGIIRALWARVPVPVEVATVAARLGASTHSVGQRMARLARAGVLVRCGRLYREVTP